MIVGALRLSALVASIACLLILAFKDFGSALGVTLVEGGFADQATYPLAFVGAALMGLSKAFEQKIFEQKIEVSETDNA